MKKKRNLGHFVLQIKGKPGSGSVPIQNQRTNQNLGHFRFKIKEKTESWSLPIEDQRKN